MVENDGNIDILFRDGLKNLEVLPPSEVWEGISAITGSRPGLLRLMRMAAAIAALVSIGLLAFFVGLRSSSDIIGPMVSDLDMSQFDQGMPPFSYNEENNFIAMVDEGGINAESAAGEKEMSSNNNQLVNRGRMNGGTVVRGLIRTGNVLNYTGPDEYVKRTGLIIPEATGIDNSQTSSIDDDGLKPVIIDDKRSSQKRWMLGAKISPTYMSANLKADNNTFNNAGKESSLISYSGGLAISYNIAKRVSFQTGLYYSSLGRRISDIKSYTGYAAYSSSKGGKIFGVETASGTIASTNNDIFLADVSGDRISSIYTSDNFDPDKADLSLFGNSLRQSFEYLEVPFLLSYKFIDRQLDFNIMGGFTYGFLLDNSVYVVSDDIRLPVGSTEDITSLLLSSALGLSLQYSLNENFLLNFEPSFRYHLNQDGMLKPDNPFSFGVFSGIYYKF